ncbi:phage tail protein [Citrobacter werkmanii]|uniref:phage tail-collar fiber domain-containing protein n=1 Tax=Citrobacter werkmanii TaxID=67827 RepID=UPI00254BB401|nr:phage tail protein [Citrobacter werkmanii]
MSQTAITLAFEHWKAQQGATGEPVLLDEFVFANVPGLNPDTPVDRSEALPPVEQIVHRQPVTRTGVVNENGVVYSAVLGADVGDFSFNWIGLLNKASGTLAMIVHAPVQQKLKTAEGQQGNVLTRSFLMEYNGAQTETGINTPAETWQIDFTARMAGMDERQRLENRDIYGAAAFFGDGWLVGKTGNQFFVTKGTGYVAGLRTSLAANQNITVTTKPVKVWLDVCWTGSLTSVWNAQYKITVAANLADYVQNGVQHYVFAVASIDVNGDITDLRPKGTLNEQQASDALKKHEQSRNHPDASTSEKGFVQLSSATDSDSEKTAATPKAVKAANDNANTRLDKDQNLNDIPDKAKARTALQLGSAATAALTTSTTDDATGRVLTVGYQGIGGNAAPLTKGDFNQLYPSGFINGQNNGPNNPTLYMGFNVRHADAYQFTLVGRQQRYFAQCCEAGAFKGWDEFYTTAHKPTAADVGALPITGGALNGSLGIGVANALGGNSIVLGDNDTGFKQEGDGILNVYANSALVMRFIASLIESLKPLKVNGNCIATGEIQAANGAVRLAADGNIYGSMWGGWMMNYLTNTFQLKGNFTPAGQAYTKAESDARYVQNIRVSAPQERKFWDGAGWSSNDSAFATAIWMVGGSSNVGGLYVRYLQKNINGTWINVTA